MNLQSQSQQNLQEILQTTLDQMELFEFNEAYHLGDVLFSPVVEKLEKQNVEHIKSYVYKEWKKQENYVFICLTELTFKNETFVVITQQEDAPEESDDLYLKPVIVKIYKKSDLLEEGKDIFNTNPDELYYELALKNHFNDMIKNLLDDLEL